MYAVPFALRRLYSEISLAAGYVYRAVGEPFSLDAMLQQLAGPVGPLAKVERDNRRAQTRITTTATLLVLLLTAGAEQRTAHASPSVDRTALTDENLRATLESHRIVVMAGCTSDRNCEILETELERAAKILARVAQDDTSSMALGSVALHRTVETAVIKERYRFAAPDAPKDDSAEPHCQTKVVLNGLETDFGLTDDGSPPLVSNLARSLVTGIMREIVPGAKAQQENAGLVTELTSTNFNKVLAQTKKEGRSLLINFYQPPVSWGRLPSPHVLIFSMLIVSMFTTRIG